MKRVLTLLALLPLCCLSLLADRLHFSNVSTEAGLSNKMVLSVAQDAEGFIWMATAEGLDRYDGSEFKVYRHVPGEIRSLGSSWVNDVLLLDDGRLLVATEMGLDVFDEETDSFSPYPALNDTQSLLTTLRFKCVYEDAESIWAGTSEGLVRINKASRLLDFIKLAPASADTRANEIKDILRGPDGTLWIASFDGLYAFHDRDFTHERHIVRDFRPYDQQNNYISSLCLHPADPGHLYVGTSNGLAIMDLQDLSCRYFRSETSHLCNNDIKTVAPLDEERLLIGTNGGLSLFSLSDASFETCSNSVIDRTSIASQTVWCSFEDNMGVVWLGTSNGVSKINKNRKSLDLYRAVSRDGDAIRDVMVSDIVFHPDGHRWIGTNDGIRVYDARMGFERAYTLHGSGLPHNQIKRFLRTANGTVWVGTNNGIAYYDPRRDAFRPVTPDRDDISLKYVYDMKEDVDGDILVNISNGLCLFSPEYDAPGSVRNCTCREIRIDSMVPSGNTEVTYMDTDAEGRTWFGTINDGLFCYDKRADRIRQFVFRDGDPESLNSNRIYTIHVDRGGTVWVGTDMGLCRLDPHTGKFLRFSDDPDLSMAVRTITSDGKGRLWICLLNKIVMFDFERNSKIICDVNRDLDCSELEYNSYCESDGLLYFGGYGGVVKVDPASMKINMQKAPMRITSTHIGSNSLSVSFALLDYTSESNNKYLYRLSGYDKEWQPADAGRNRVSYPNLSPGKYVFRVKGCNSDGIFSDEASFGFTIPKPLWLRWWALLLYALVLAALIGIGVWQYSLHRTLSQQLDAEKEERNRVESLNKVKMNFFTNISHEFKTPLSLILGPLESLMEHSEDENQFRQMELMKQNGERMLRLINQILDLKEIDNDKISLNLSSGDIVAFARNVSESFRENAARRGMNYEFISEKEISCSFDKDKMENILFNLLSNAFKFTPDGGSVQLSVSQEDSSAGPAVKIRVADSGQGMSEEEMKHVFDRFYQGSAKSYEKITSTGIGLGLTKDFVELHGGSISVDSSLGAGSAFCVTIPCHPAGPGPVQEADETQMSDKRIVVIDDNPDILSFIKMSLGESFTVRTTTSPTRGLELVRENCPDVVIIDVMMPEMDGFELCRRIREDELTSHIPVIFLTARSQEDDVAKGYDSGADGYLTKPFSIKVLRAKIDVLVKSRDKLREHYAQTLQTPSLEIREESVDDRFIATLAKMIEENLDNSEYSVQDLCEDTHYSYLQIYRKVKAVTGVSVNEFIRNLRLARAANLLAHSDMRVSEIMYSVGFSTHSYFTKCFKAVYGLTPKEYASRQREKADRM